MKLFKKLIREIKQAPLQFIALMLVIAIGAFFYSGLSTYSSKQRTYVQHYFQAHNLSDLTVLYNDISMDDIASLSKLEGISKIEARKTFEATQLFQGDRASLHIHSLPKDNTINTPTVTQGELPTSSNEILLDSHYAKEHQFKVGDKLSLTINKSAEHPEKTVNFTISGLGENVEYVKKNATQNHKNEGFGYVTEATIASTFTTLSYNEILLNVKNLDIDQVGKRIEEFSKANTLSYVDQVSKQRSFGYTQITQTIYNNGMMSKVIPLVLFIISAIILFLTMSRTIDSQRNQIGIMKALGIKDSKIMLHYMGYPLLVSIFGAILGCVLSSIVFIPMVTASSSKSYALPGITYSLSWLSIVPPMIIASIFGIISVYLSGKSILRECAAQAMRPKPPKKMKKLLIEKIPRLWTSISYSNKLILRNIFLNKQKAFASSVGVLVSTTLLITALGTQASMLKIANQINEVYTYDLKVDYRPGINPDSLSLPSGIGGRYSLSSMPIELYTDNNRENATLIVTPKENKLIQYFDENDKSIDLMDHGVLVPKSYATSYNIKKGDTVTFKFTTPEMNNKSIKMKVASISSQYSNPSFYITPTYLASFDINYSPTSLLVKGNDSTSVADLRHFFEQDQQVELISDQSDLKEIGQYMLKQNNFMFIMFLICAVILSFSSMFTISSINIYERSRELATLKVLGYQKNKINKLIFWENIILTTFAIIIAIPIGGKFYALVVNALASTHQQIPDSLNTIIIIIAIAAAYTLTILSNLVLRKKVKNINMIESLKSLE
jgi:putative ABC transport system permease protein